MKTSKDCRANVRMTPLEYARILEDAKNFSQTVSERLKDVYFKNSPFTPAMPKEEAQRVATELARIGNNFNQIARRVNSGFMEGFNTAFDDVRDALSALRNFTKGYDGGR